MQWKIKDDPVEVDLGYDGVSWRWPLVSADGRREWRVDVTITGSANCTGEEHLPDRVARLRESQGLSEVEEVLDWAEPPEEIVADTVGVDYKIPVPAP